MTGRPGYAPGDVCPAAFHGTIKRSPETFALNTRNPRPWVGEGLIIAECKHCTSTIAIEDPTVSREIG